MTLTKGDELLSTMCVHYRAVWQYLPLDKWEEQGWQLKECLKKGEDFDT